MLSFLEIQTLDEEIVVCFREVNKVLTKISD